MRYRHDDVGDGYDIFMFIVIFMFMGLIAVLVAVGVFKEPSHGYGGSPGHMSPMEVEELYNKNRK